MVQFPLAVLLLLSLEHRLGICIMQAFSVLLQKRRFIISLYEFKHTLDNTIRQTYMSM